MPVIRAEVPSPPARAGVTVAATLAVTGALLLAPGSVPEAEAASGHALAALRVAASKQGLPYRWGGTGPDGFDCSGLTQYSYKQVGKSLPRTAAQQYDRTSRTAAGSRQRGDLVFFVSGGNVYHVAMYAGGGKVWHAPKPGKTVRLEKIWTENVSYGRVH
ncbi:C40 family peptidase [Streptomyces sp. NPDC012888]|uniref:C40 family peptidase n=1 Tax=Streptomyces sp. NPDC012888 TaxID=3364855 RepID=UPI0036AADE18